MNHCGFVFLLASAAAAASVSCTEMRDTGADALSFFSINAVLEGGLSSPAWQADASLTVLDTAGDTCVLAMDESDGAAAVFVSEQWRVGAVPAEAMWRTDIPAEQVAVASGEPDTSATPWRGDVYEDGAGWSVSLHPEAAYLSFTFPEGSSVASLSLSAGGKDYTLNAGGGLVEDGLFSVADGAGNAIAYIITVSAGNYPDGISATVVNGRGERSAPFVWDSVSLQAGSVTPWGGDIIDVPEPGETCDFDNARVRGEIIGEGGEYQLD